MKNTEAFRSGVIAGLWWALLVVVLAFVLSGCSQYKGNVHQCSFAIAGTDNGEGIIETEDPTEKIRTWLFSYLPEYEPRRQMEGKEGEFWTQWPPRSAKLLEPQVLGFVPPRPEPIPFIIQPWSPEKWQAMLDKQFAKMLQY
jgi:hypothetical protein